MKYFAIAVTAFGIMLGTLPAARADTTCTPTSPSPGSTVNSNLVVPAGTTCTLTGVTVPGNVLVQTNVALTISNTMTTTIVGNLTLGAGTRIEMTRGSMTYLIVDGNVTVNQCNEFGMASFTIGGNVSVQNCTAGTGHSATVSISGTTANTTVDGNFTCTGNAGGCFVDAVTVKGNVQVNDNGSGSVVEDTTIGGNLQCSGNMSGVGVSSNTVGGRQTGQCATL